MLTEKKVRTLKNYIGGEFIVPSGKMRRTSVNPANHEEVIAEFFESTSEEAKHAIDVAAKAYESWKLLSPPQRGEYLYKVASLLEEKKEELATVIVQEEGKTYGDAVKEVAYAAGIVRFYAGEGQRLNGKIIQADMPNIQIQTVKEPLGVVLVVTPWNFPLSIPAWKIAPAILSGNTVVLKASSETPYVAMKLMEVFAEAGVPKGVVNYVITPGKMVTEMIHHPSVQAITFTGSNQVGTSIYREGAKSMKRVLLEMGGKNPLIVMEDADIQEAVQLTIAGAYGQTGQACTATSRVIVHKDIAETYTRLLVEKTKELKIGNGFDENVDIGPQVNRLERDATIEIIQRAVQDGAKLLCGGEVPKVPGGENGFYVQPTVLSHVRSDMEIAQKEVFGPVVCIMETGTIDEAIYLANDVEYGLSAAICTKNSAYVTRALNEVEVGILKVNMTTTGTFYQAPFGGFKQSSTGTYKELGSEALEFYCQSKTRYLNI